MVAMVVLAMVVMMVMVMLVGLGMDMVGFVGDVSDGGDIELHYPEHAVVDM